MKVLHLINHQRDDGPGLLNLEKCSAGTDTYDSGYWPIDLDVAQTLIGGMLYLHETKARPSRFGGEVLAVRQVTRAEFPRSKRVIFTFRAMREGRGQRWRGASHSMASIGTIVDLDP